MIWLETFLADSTMRHIAVVFIFLSYFQPFVVEEALSTPPLVTVLLDLTMFCQCVILKKTIWGPAVKDLDKSAVGTWEIHFEVLTQPRSSLFKSWVEFTRKRWISYPRLCIKEYIGEMANKWNYLEVSKGFMETKSNDINVILAPLDPLNSLN